MNRIFVHVDRVVLRGFAETERRAVVAGLQEALVQTFIDRAELLRLEGAKHLPTLRLERGRMRFAPGKR